MAKAGPGNDESNEAITYQVNERHTSYNDLVDSLRGMYDHIVGFETKDYFEDDINYDLLVNPNDYEPQVNPLEGDVLVVFSDELLRSDALTAEETEQLLEEGGHNFIAPNHAFGRQLYHPHEVGEEDVTGHWLPRFSDKALYVTQNNS